MDYKYNFPQLLLNFNFKKCTYIFIYKVKVWWMPHLFRTVNFTIESLQVPFNDIYVIDIFQKFIMKSRTKSFSATIAELSSFF